MAAANLFSVETEPDVLIVVPQDSISGFSQTQVEAELAQIKSRMAADGATVNLVIDFHRARYIGSSMLEAMLALARCVQGLGGKIALCSMSQVVAEVVHVARFDTMWPIYPTRAEACAAVRGK